MTRKVVINECYGGFGLSQRACKLYLSIKYGVPVKLIKEDRYVWYVSDLEVKFYSRNIPRDDGTLIQVVESMGEEANGRCAKLKIVEIPADIEWTIEEYDGNEWVAEKHDTWC